MTRSIALMGTIVTIEVAGREDGLQASDGVEGAIDRAFGWFLEVESRCTRFEPTSELMRLCASVGGPVSVSEILCEAIRFALAVAEASGGAFDPTVGHAMETRGFDRHYRTGQSVRTAVAPCGTCGYQDVVVDAERRTVTLRRSLGLDLGAVAKGLAIDLAARELAPFEHFAIDAGGDLRLGGLNPDGEAWSVGVRHPRGVRELLAVLQVSNMAVCTSGDYERRSPVAEGHHILDPRVMVSAAAVVSATVVAPTAMVADALATAAFVLGPTQGMALLEQQGVDGLMVSPDLERYATRGFARFGPTVLTHAEGLAAAHLHRDDRPGDGGRGRGARRARAV